jgi:ABC-type nitrate/sulfonate/bicarbonate transport system substrate-binding protein
VAAATGVVDAAMMTFPHNITAAEQGFRELMSFIASDIIQLQGAIVTRDGLLQSDPGMVEKFLRATIRGLIYYSTNRGGAVPILARNAKSSEELAGKVYDWSTGTDTGRDIKRRSTAAGDESAVGARRAQRYFDCEIF